MFYEARKKWEICDTCRNSEIKTLDNGMLILQCNIWHDSRGTCDTCQKWECEVENQIDKAV